MRNALRTLIIGSSLIALALPAHAASNNCDTTAPIIVGAVPGWVLGGLAGAFVGGTIGNEVGKSNCQQPAKAAATKTKQVVKPWVNPDTIKRP